MKTKENREKCEICLPNFTKIKAAVFASTAPLSPLQGTFPEAAFLGGWIGSTMASAIALFFLRTYFIQRGANLHSRI